jgi:hypothetical protein
MDLAARCPRHAGYFAWIVGGVLLLGATEARSFAGFLPSAAIGYAEGLAGPDGAGGADPDVALAVASRPSGSSAEANAPGMSGAAAFPLQDAEASQAAPEPTTLILIGGGLLGLAGWRLVRRG